MSAEFLEAFVEAGADEAREFARLLAAGQLEWTDLQRLCEAYSQFGVCSLLLHGGTDPYWRGVTCSAGATRHFLQTQKDERIVLSKLVAIFDCINAGFWDCLQELGELCPAEANADYEYPEDHSYARLLLQLAAQDDKAAQETLAAFVELATDEDEPRVEVCTALLAADGEAFHENLCLFLDLRAEDVEARIGRGALTDAQWAWQRYFSSEGLTLLRLAQRRRLPFDSHYLHVPQELLGMPGMNFDADAWRRF